MICPAISLWQPWAALPFATGQFGQLKKHETRHWPYPSRLTGCRVLVHAAKTRAEMRDVPRLWREAVGEFHFGAFLGHVRLTGCFRTEDWESDHDDEAAGDWSVGRYAWRMEDPQKFEVPIPAVGRQGFWNVEVPIAA